MREPVYPFVAALLALLLVSGIVSVLHGCATARDFAQGVVSSGAVVLDESDVVAAEAYRDAARAALADSQTLAQYLERMEPYDELVVALEGAADVLRALQSLVDGWDDAARGRWSEAAHEALTAFEAVFRAFRSVGAAPPASLFEFLGTVVDLPEP